MYIVGLVAGIVMNFIITASERKVISNDAGYAKRLRTIKPVHTVINALIIFVFGVAGAMTMGVVYGKLFGVKANVALFGSLILPPIVMFLYYNIMRFDWKYAMDLLAVEVWMILGFSKIRCSIAGCCYGRVVPGFP